MIRSEMKLLGTTRVLQVPPEITDKRFSWYDQVVRMEENHTRGKRRRKVIPTVEGCVSERHDDCWAQSGRRNEQGRIEEIL